MSATIDMLAGWSGYVTKRNGKSYYVDCIQGDQDRPGCINITWNCNAIADVYRDGKSFWADKTENIRDRILMEEHDIVRFSPDPMPEGVVYEQRVSAWEEVMQDNKLDAWGRPVNNR